MKIAIGCDPNAENEKQALMKFIEAKGLGEVEDFGSTDPIYANVAIKVGEAVASKEYDRGILLCGTGLGVSIAANKVKGAYAALLTDAYSAESELFTQIFLTNEFVPGCGSQPKVDAFRKYDMERK